MSDERDPSALPKWEELLRRLEQTHGQLESAYADYLKASADSERALKRVIDSFGELSNTVRALVPEPGEIKDDRDVASDDGDISGNDKNSSTDLVASPSTPSAEADHSQNALPAHLHSRGVTIPQDSDGPPQPKRAPRAPVSTGAEAVDSTANSPFRIEQPILVDAPYPEGPGPFSGLKKESRILLTNDGFGVAPVLNDILSREGYRVRVGNRRPDFSAPADTVIFLGSLRAPSDLDDAMSVIDDAMYVAERMTTRLMQPDSGFVAVVDTAGGFGLDRFDPVAAPYGALLGLCRLLDRRHPGARTRLIDLDGGQLSGEKIAELVAEELLNGGDESPIALGQEHRKSVRWAPFSERSRPAGWLEDNRPPLVYMPGPNAVLATAVERLAIAHELPVAVLRRRHAPPRMAQKFDQLGIETRSINYDLNRLFSAMDFLDALRDKHGPIAAIIAESVPAKKPNDLARWGVMRPPLDEFNALLAMTINDPLRLLGVGLGPRTPPVIASALRYFARAESLRRNDHLRVRLAHMHRAPQRNGSGIDPCDFALTEFLSGSDPLIAEVRFQERQRR